MKLKLKNIPVLYINLKSDTQKLEAIQSTVDEIGFKQSEHILGVVADPMPHLCADIHPEFEQGRCNIEKYRGCAMAHIKALEHANAIYPDQPVLILEDDCIVVNKLRKIDVPDDADAVYLGIGSGGMIGVDLSDIDKCRMTWRNAPTAFEYNPKGVSRILGMGSAHAILYMNNTYRNAAIEVCRLALEKYTVPDLLFNALQPKYNVYGLNEPIFAQSGVFLNKTDISLKDLHEENELGISDYV